jgi:hypothetical protein
MYLGNGKRAHGLQQAVEKAGNPGNVGLVA